METTNCAGIQVTLLWSLMHIYIWLFRGCIDIYVEIGVFLFYTFGCVHNIFNHYAVRKYITLIIDS